MKILSRRSFYKIHRDIGILIGLFIIIEALTGILDVWPFEKYYRPAPKVMALNDFKKVRIIPAQAVERLSNELGAELEVNSVNLKLILNSAVYVISLKSGATYLIDASTGERFLITEELATKIASDEFPEKVPVLKTFEVKTYSPTYIGGPLPIFRVEFSDSQRTISHISPEDGKVSRSNSSVRARWFLHSFHTLGVLNIISVRGAYRKGLLILLASLVIVVTLIGYYQYFSRKKT